MAGTESAAEPMTTLRTIDLTDEQLAHIRKVIVRDLAELQSIVRSAAFENYGEVESARMHEEIRIASALIGVLPMPMPRREFT